jgi:diadenosine tetraphosphate (Ap4A) HIT family hydrolase
MFWQGPAVGEHHCELVMRRIPAVTGRGVGTEFLEQSDGPSHESHQGARSRDNIDVAERDAFDSEAYQLRAQNGPCFVCATVAGNPDYVHEVIFEDENVVAFLNRYPTQLGYTIVAPKDHIERWDQDQSLQEHTHLQTVIFNVARALTAALPVERVYVLSLGSAAGNAHVHWHVVPLPPGVPYDEQQFPAVMAENGLIQLDAIAASELAARLRRSMASLTAPT